MKHTYTVGTRDFKTLAAAKKDAQEYANEMGHSVTVYHQGQKEDRHTATRGRVLGFSASSLKNYPDIVVKPKNMSQQNPKRRVLVPAKVEITPGGKIRVFVSAKVARRIKSNPRGGTLKEYKVIFTSPHAARNQMHAVYATTAGGASRIASKDKKHLFADPRNWKILSIKRS